MLNCPGYNARVLPQVAIGLGIATATTPDAAKAQAKQEAEGKALSNALAQFGKHLCPPPCISIPIPVVTASGADVITEVSGGGPFSAFGWAKAQLDVLCLQISVPVNPPGPAVPPPPPQPPTLKAKTIPPETAPVPGPDAPKKLKKK